MTATPNLRRYHQALDTLMPVQCYGQLVQVVGLAMEVVGLAMPIGDVCRIYPAAGAEPIEAEVVGFRDKHLILMPFAETHGIKQGAMVERLGSHFTVPVGPQLLGRVVDGLGRPLDGKGPLRYAERYPLTNPSPHPLNRTPIVSPMAVGVRAIDGLLTCGRGQRIGIFSGSGVGKSTLLGMIARNAVADVNVIALIGERGREVQDFIARCLGKEGLKRSVVVVSTSDQPALMRQKGALVATAMAEYFRDQGLDVIFLMDSITRFCMALREIGLASGEPPATKGYTPSVFSALPKLLERSGTSDRGTITGFYTVLMEADDPLEPITDTVRSILDGHIYLARELANEAHYPSIDVLGSVSRLMPQLVKESHARAATRLKQLVACYHNARDLVSIGAYVAGSDPQIDEALAALPRINAFLRQTPEEYTPFEETIVRLETLFSSRETADESA